MGYQNCTRTEPDAIGNVSWVCFLFVFSIYVFWALPYKPSNMLMLNLTSTIILESNIATNNFSLFSRNSISKAINFSSCGLLDTICYNRNLQWKNLTVIILFMYVHRFYCLIKFVVGVKHVKRETSVNNSRYWMIPLRKVLGDYTKMRE